MEPWRTLKYSAQNLSNYLWTLVSSFNHKAQQFYKKMGFIKVGQLDDLIVEDYSEFLLRKQSVDKFLIQ